MCALVGSVSTGSTLVSIVKGEKDESSTEGVEVIQAGLYTSGVDGERVDRWEDDEGESRLRSRIVVGDEVVGW